ncbi:MAG: holo-ACP synthase [Candidatus Omnitrophica bacterium]|nr:holo-ACP synthase [Candidatus Omnitrophota bacterium]
MEIRQGIDIVEIRRMKDACERHGERFLKRVFSIGERSYCESKRMKYEHYAARFAAKEAVLKVVKASRAERYRFRDIEVRRHPTGKPYIHLLPAVRKRLGLPSEYQMELSLAHEREYAVAAVILILPDLTRKSSGKTRNK